jgi:hypothetical protein
MPNSIGTHPNVNEDRWGIYSLTTLLKMEVCMMADLEKQPVSNTSSVVLTIGHSTRTLEVFIQFLNLHTVRKIVDVRTVPRSRHNPQFNQETLPGNLRAAGIGYLHMPGLGGLRRPRPNSPNTGWHN